MIAANQTAYLSAWEAIGEAESTGDLVEINAADPALIRALDSIVIDCAGDRVESEDVGDYPGLYVTYYACTDSTGEGRRVTWQVRAWLRERLPHEDE